MNKVTTKDIKRIYKEKIKPHVRELDKERKKIISNSLFLVLLSAPLSYFVYAYIYPNVNQAGTSDQFLVSFIPPIALISFYFRMKLGKFKKRYKNKIIKTALEEFFPGSIYNQEGSFTKSEFNALKLFSTTTELFQCEDEIVGTIGHTKFKMYEIFARAQVKDSDGRRSREKVIFSGFLYNIDFNKHFNGDTVIQTDVAEKFLGSWLGSKLQGVASIGKRKLVRLEDPRFEKHFVVYSTDSQEARYIISPKFMESIMTLKTTNNRNIQLAFQNNQFFMTVVTRKNFFEPSLIGPLVSYKDLKEIIDVYNMVGEIVKELDLNTRIWTKS